MPCISLLSEAPACLLASEPAFTPPAGRAAALQAARVPAGTGAAGPGLERGEHPAIIKNPSSRPLRIAPQARSPIRAAGAFTNPRRRRAHQSAPKARSPTRAAGALTNPRRRRAHQPAPKARSPIRAEGAFTNPRRRRVHPHPLGRRPASTLTRSAAGRRPPSPFTFSPAQLYRKPLHQLLQFRLQLGSPRSFTAAFSAPECCRRHARRR
jgi:hypothetical protein